MWKTQWIPQPFEMLGFSSSSSSVIDPQTDMINPEEPTLAHVLWGRPEFLKLEFVFYAGKKNNNLPPKKLEKVVDWSRASVAPQALRCLLIL